MQYVKLTSGQTIIEFHNNWLGEETVIVNGQIVSRKSSIMGTDHHFTAFEQGHNVQYVLRSKVDRMTMQVRLDLFRHGQLSQGDIPVKYGNRPRDPQNRAKKEGVQKLSQYDIQEAIELLIKGRDFNPKDPEVYFHLACAYSVMEETAEAFEALKNAVQNGLKETEVILNHDMLAFVRMHEAFEDFLNSDFKEYDVELVADKKEDEEG